MPQSLASVVIHAVFSVKHRRPLLGGAIGPEVHAYLAEVLKNEGSVPIRVGGYDDHVHLLFHLSRTQALADAVREVKTASSKWLKTKGPELGDFAWQGGYAAFSVGYREIETVARYIENQPRRHARYGFQDEMRRLFEEHGVVFDERYVWD